MIQKIWIFGFTVFLAATFDIGSAATQEAASKVHFRIEPSSDPLAIDKPWGEDAKYVRTFLITAENGAIDGLRLLASHLQKKGGGPDLDQSNITFKHNNAVIRDDLSFAENETKGIEVSVSAIEHPGTYEGVILIKKRGQPIAQAQKLNLIVTASETPQLEWQTGSDALDLKLTNCPPWTCWLASVLLPQAFFQEHRNLQIKNEGTSAAQDFKMSTQLYGEHTGQQLTNQLYLETTKALQPGEISDLSLRIARSEIAPDHYTGALEFTVDNGDVVSIPVDIKVRSGPLGVVIVIFVGILIGRLAKYMQDHGGPQAEALKSIYALQAEVEGTLIHQDVNLLASLLKKCKNEVHENRLASAKQQMDAIRAKMQVLAQVRSIETALSKMNGTEVDAVRDKIRNLRSTIEIANDTTGAYEAINEAFTNLKVKAASPLDESSQRQIESALASSRDSSAKIKTILARTTETPAQSKTRERLAIFAGLSNEVRAEATLWVVRPVLYCVLILGLVFVGLETLYFKEGEVFGVNRVFDYVGIFIWGLSADVASRTLSNLRGVNS